MNHVVSTAHTRSRTEIVDPAYSVAVSLPSDPVDRDNPFHWLYYPEHLDCLRLWQFWADTEDAELKAGYRGAFHRPAAVVIFSRSATGGNIAFQAAGKCEAFLDGTPLPCRETAPEFYEIILAGAGLLSIRLSVADTRNELPALRPLECESWLAALPESAPVRPERQAPLWAGLPPHRAESPQMTLTPEPIAPMVWDAGCEIFCYVEIHADACPELRVGESMLECNDDAPADREQSTELCRIAPDRWRSRHALACRYLRIVGAGRVHALSCHCLFAPVRYRGAFAWTPRMNAIWMGSAYTLRLCLQHFILDGIKRDRMPWGGDLGIGLLGTAYSFGDFDYARRSLAVLGANIDHGESINRIVDYSMWFLLIHDWYQLYSEDRDFLDREYGRICSCVEHLLQRFHTDGFRWLPAGTVVLIDWGQPPVENAAAMLLAWGLRAAVALARRKSDTVHVDEWGAELALLTARLRTFALSPDGLFYAQNPLFSTAFGRHANALAILSGVADPAESGRIAEWLCESDAPQALTPYMAIWEIMAIAEAGQPQRALAKLEKIWGGMLDLGATTFWEGFDPADSEAGHYAFYERPFGKSLCHSWAAGPVFALAQILFGLKPRKDGWREFEFKATIPFPDEISVTVPTPYGEIQLEASAGQVRCQAPAECSFFVL